MTALEGRGETPPVHRTAPAEERAGKPLLSGVEQLIDEVFFDPDVARQHVSEEGDHGFLSCLRQDGQPDGAVLDIHDVRGWIALGKDLYCGFVLDAL